jgi:hypothetical protein
MHSTARRCKKGEAIIYITHLLCTYRVLPHTATYELWYGEPAKKNARIGVVIAKILQRRRGEGLNIRGKQLPLTRSVKKQYRQYTWQYARQYPTYRRTRRHDGCLAPQRVREGSSQR